MSINSVYLPVINKTTDVLALMSSSTKDEMGALSISSRPVDYSITSIPKPLRPRWIEIALFIAKIIIPIYWIYFLFQRMVMSLVYPAQSQLLGNSIKKVDQVRESLTQDAQFQYISRHVVLEKNGIRYSGLMIGNKSYFNNGRWMLHADGNCVPAEYAVRGFLGRGLHNDKSQCNFLFINNPGVGRSQGWATPETIGDAQEVGICFLEDVIKAHQIVLSGFSIGGAAIGQAILKHQFQKNIQYTVLFQQTFDRLSNCVSIMVGNWAGSLIKWLGLEMDTVAASEKLKQLNIEQIIMQGGVEIPPATQIAKNLFVGDGVIPAQASLGYSLSDQSIAPRHFVGLSQKHKGSRKNNFYNFIGKIVILHRENLS